MKKRKYEYKLHANAESLHLSMSNGGGFISRMLSWTLVEQAHIDVIENMLDEMERQIDLAVAA